ncbi:hypothetical protein C8J57DRAFT_1507490 [Mycena rebaudengoi]|nr:hypothetical protein C8J57DRAFT_1507490 [Mycena rebaudengoi]
MAPPFESDLGLAMVLPVLILSVKVYCGHLLQPHHLPPPRRRLSPSCLCTRDSTASPTRTGSLRRARETGFPPRTANAQRGGEEGRDVKCPPRKNPLTSSLIDDRSANWRKCCAGTSAAPVDCPSATMQHTSALPTRCHPVPAPIDSRGLSFWCVRCLTFWIHQSPHAPTSASFHSPPPALDAFPNPIFYCFSTSASSSPFLPMPDSRITLLWL